MALSHPREEEPAHRAGEGAGADTKRPTEGADSHQEAGVAGLAELPPQEEAEARAGRVEEPPPAGAEEPAVQAPEQLQGDCPQEQAAEPGLLRRSTGRRHMSN